MSRVGTSALAAFALVVGVATPACSATPSEEGGTPKFDASPPAVSEDGGACSGDEDAGVGTTWGDLYRDYFGPTGKASCAGTGVCHGDTSQPGYAGSGYVCPPTAAQCYAGITASKAGLVTPGQPIADPTTTGLYAILRKCSGNGLMPKAPVSVVFTAGDMARIAAWIQAEAPND